MSSRIRMLPFGLLVGCLTCVVQYMPGLTPSKGVQARPQASLQATIETLRTSTNVPAVAAVTFTSTTVGEVAVTGVRKLGDPTLVTLSDLWHIGSITKSFTSALAARLVEQGKLSWSMTLGELVGVARAMKFAGVTLTQILSHRSGLPADLTQEVFAAMRKSSAPLPVQRQALLDFALANEPVSPPGSAFLYSNSGYIVVGAILEQRTGTAWEDLLRDHLLTPLRLTTAGFGAPGTRDALAQPRGHRLSGNTVVPVEPGPGADNLPFMGPAGTLHMSILDLARWGQEHLRGERGRDGLLSAATYRFLHASQGQSTPREDRPLSNYALGWGNPQLPGVRIVTHSGSNTMWCAVLAFDPAADRGIVIVTNGPNSLLASVNNAANQWILDKEL